MVVEVFVILQCLCHMDTQCGNREGQEVIDMKGFSPISSSSALIVSLK